MDVVESKWYEMDMSLNDVKNLLSANIKTMSRSFIAAGYYMKYIRDRELFRDGGYNSIWEFAEDQYGIKKSAASRCGWLEERCQPAAETPDEKQHDFVEDTKIADHLGETTALPVMKNNDQRKVWLRNYKDWGLWYEDKNIGVKYYKYDFENGARLIAEEYVLSGTEWMSEHETAYLHLVGGPEPEYKNGAPKWSYHTCYVKYPNSETELVEFLKELQK